MFIKTVSTTSGINPIKFDETGGVFYWILNTGLSTIYASTKSAFTAGDDGVVSLGPKESRRLETNNDTIYILGEGQVEIHNQRDGICSFKQAPTSSGGGGTVDAYTKTESDAKYAQKTDIPTSLPANGGNADTVDGYHVDNLIHESESIPPKYITEFLRINDDTKSVERWDTSNLRVEFANNAAKAENADTVDGLHAEKFMRYEPDKRLTTSINDTTTAGTYGVYNATPDFPTGYGDWGLLEVQVYGTICYQIIKFESGIIINRTKIVNQTEWSEWKEISTTPIKKMTFPSVATNSDGAGSLFSADFGTPIVIACTSRVDTQCTPFYYRDGNLWRLLAKDAAKLDPIPAGSYSFDVWYI